MTASPIEHAPRPPRRDDLRPRSSRNAVPIATANLLAFLIVSAGAFFPRNDLIFSGFDGYYLRALIHELFRFGAMAPGLPVALFEGMGMPVVFDPLLLPSLLPLALFGETPGAGFGFMCCATLMFLSTYALGRALGLEQAAALLAAWALPLLSLPYRSGPQIYTAYNVAPQLADAISMTMLALAVLARGYAKTRVAWEPVALALLILWLFLAAPLAIVLLLPAIPIALGIIANAARTPRFLLKTGLFLLPPLVFLALGGGAYLWGLYSYTAATFFPLELGYTGRYWDLVSALFTNDFPRAPTGFSLHIVKPPAALLFGLALAGLALSLRKADRPARAMASTVLASAVAVAAYGTIYLTTHGSWILPFPVYFEFVLWPLSALFAAHALVALAKSALSTSPALCARLIEGLGHLARKPARLILLPAALGTALGALLAWHPVTLPPVAWYLRPSETAITKALGQASGIAPGKPFRGYTVNLASFNWGAASPYDFRVFKAFGNPHRLQYLWMHDIPTLEAYAASIEPPLYAIATRLLSGNDVAYSRNLVFLTRPDVALLQSLGVRFVITESPLPAPASLLVALSAPDVAQYVYELPDPNYGSYSPTDVAVAHDATEAAAGLADPHFDFRRSVVLASAPSGSLQPAESSSAILTRGGWRIRAKSAGLSLLLIPLQYSHCLSLTEHQAEGGRVVAVEQANLVSTALVFRGEVDVTLSLIVSPFWHASCRVADVRAMNAFGLASLPRSIAAQP